MIIHGDCLEKLKELENNSVDCVVTDPPYGYSFMGKDWDKALPTIEVWKECLRVLKPGAFAFVMSAPRQDVLSQMIVRLGDAGFDNSFSSIYWSFASGFPKALNIKRKLEKDAESQKTQMLEMWRTLFTTSQRIEEGDNRGNLQELLEDLEQKIRTLDGSYGGFQPKPAVEVIIVAMKPLSEKTYVDQALKNGKGITWLDDCRIPANDKEWGSGNIGFAQHFVAGTEEYREASFNRKEKINEGRFPANLLVSDDVLNDGTITKSNGAFPQRHGSSSFVSSEEKEKRINLTDSGGYSRYFSLDKWANTLPFLITPKASKSEKNRGLEEFPLTISNRENAALTSVENGSPQSRNSHPTVKPLKLMSYLITLGSREGDLILDPFAGSGTTLVAAKHLNRKFIGIEREEEYVKIAEARLKAVNPSLFDETLAEDLSTVSI